MISEIDIRDWEPKEIKNILTGIEFNYVYNGKQSPFGKLDMDVLMKFLTKAEEIKRSLEPQIPALFKKAEEGFGLGVRSSVDKAEEVVGWFAP